MLKIAMGVGWVSCKQLSPRGGAPQDAWEREKVVRKVLGRGKVTKRAPRV
jgi:hypothetical protein